MSLKNQFTGLLMFLSSTAAIASQSTWVPIATGDITTIIPLPNAEIIASSTYSTTSDSINIRVGSVGASEAFYFRTSDVLTGAKGQWQCTTATDVASNNNIISTYTVTPGDYKYEVSACMTGTGCDLTAFSSGTLACSDFAVSKNVKIADVTGTRTPIASNSSNDYKGTVAAQFRVSETGAATYTLPISLPQGTAGVAPQISLNYNSQGGDGIAGRGWSIGAGAGVARCPKNITMDNKSGGVSLTASDRLCLNGERLILNKTTGSYLDLDKHTSDSAYWSTNASYHSATSVGNYVKPHYAAGILKAFTVENKAGETHYYGDTRAINGAKITSGNFSTHFKNVSGSSAEANTTSYGSPAFLNSVAKTNTARAWMLQAIEDVKGNYINYEQSYNTVTGEHLITSIDYTGTKSAKPYASVVFNYKDNLKKQSGWLAGTQVSMTKLLASVNVNIDNKEYRTYTLSYFESGFVEEKNYLENVTECIGSSCKVPLTFTWQKPAPVTSSTERRCVDEGEGLGHVDCYDIPINSPLKPFSSTKKHLTSASNAAKSHIFDFNGDGYSDIVYPENGWKVKYGPTFSQVKTITTNPTLDDSAQYARIIDVDGDGVYDLLVSRNSSSNWHVLTSTPFAEEDCRPKNGGEPGVIDSGELYCYTRNVNARDLGFKATGLSGAVQVADVVNVNGEEGSDGLQDLVRVSGTTVYVRKNNGNGNFSAEVSLFSLPRDSSYDHDITYSSNFDDGLYRYSANMKNSAFLDVNGDSVTDMLLRRTKTTRRCNGNDNLRPNSIPTFNVNQQFKASKSSVNKLPQTKEISVAVDSGNSLFADDVQRMARASCSTSTSYAWYLYRGEAYGAPTVVATGSALKNPRVVDLNGDGLSDIIWQNGTALKYKLSNGITLLSSKVAKVMDFSGTIRNIVSSDAMHNLSYFVDVTNDSKTDLLISNANQTSWSTYISKPIVGLPEEVIFEARGSIAFDRNYIYQFGDVNGDAKVDLLSGSSAWYVQYSAHANQLMDVINVVDNGHGVKNYINYTNISHTTDNFLQNSISTYFEADSSERYDSAGKLDNDYVSPKTGFYVVSRVDSDINVKDANSNNVNSVIYQYGGLLIHKKGLGMLGFEKLRTIDPQTCDTETQKVRELLFYDPEVGPVYVWRDVSYTDYNQCVSTETTYHQRFPFTGRPKQTVQSYGTGTNAVMLSKASNLWKTQATAELGLQVNLIGSVNSSYNLNSGLTSSQHSNQTFVSNTYDGYGNLTENITTSKPSEQRINNIEDILTYAKASIRGLLAHRTQTNNYYGASTLYQKLGRLERSTVNKSGRQGNASKTVSFTYNSGDNLLKTETTPLGTTTHLYDQWGNKRRSTLVVTDDSNTETNTRYSSTTYDVRGRYVKTASNNAGHKTSYEYNLINGLVRETVATDINGNKKTTNVDTLGRVLQSKVKVGNGPELITKSYHALCSSVSCGVSNAYSRVISISSGVAEQHKYLDKWGREVAQKVKGFDGAWVTSTKSYDTEGRLQTVTAPVKGAAFADSTTYKYDILKRVYQEISPQGITTRDYNYNVTTTTVKANKASTKIKSNTHNYLGQLTRVKDLALNGNSITELHHDYNINGQLFGTHVYKGGSYSHVQVRNFYNTLGQKEKMTDLDKGTWSYEYNGFGELIKQTNSSSQNANVFYDSLGRKTAYKDNDGLTCWFYDEKSGELGKLHQVLYKRAANQSLTACNSVRSTKQYNYSESYTYLNNGLVGASITEIDGEVFVTERGYDEFNRVKYTQYPANGFTIEHSYNSLGMATKLTNATQGHREFGKIYQQIMAMNARGQVTQVNYANGVIESKAYNDTTGYAENFNLFKGSTSFDSQDFTFDGLGNLLTRSHNFSYNGSVSDYCDEFSYDGLNRVEGRKQFIGRSTCAGSSAYQNYTYDELGNISFKQGTGSYKYQHATAKNRLTSIAAAPGTRNYTFAYDARGNMTNDGSRAIKYTSYDKAYEISQGTNRTTMFYNHARSLYKRIDSRGEGVTSSLYVKGLYERVTTATGITEHKYSVGNVVITDRSNNQNDTFYLHKDHLGSTTSITNSSGAVVQHINYDPWGKQNRFYSTGSLLGKLLQQSPAESNGYTGHKQISGLDIIHMKGRIYDPTLGRFLQADPFIQAPNNSQSYNRFAYVMNNPMSYTDPSGYFFKKLSKLSGFLAGGFEGAATFHHTNRFISNSKTLTAIGGVVVGVVTTVMCGPCSIGFSALYSSTMASYNGAGTNDALKVGGRTAATATVFYAIGTTFDAQPNSGSFFVKNSVQHIAAHAIAGGIIADLQGGKFAHGFWSAGVTKTAGGYLPQGGELSLSEVAYGTVVSMVVGGTTSVISGGKFGNGARTAAFQYLFNQALSKWSYDQQLKKGSLKLGADAEGEGLFRLGDAVKITFFPKGTFVVAAHGNSGGISLNGYNTTLDIEQIASFMNDNNYNGTTPIFLQVCDSGTSGLAQLMADYYNTTVIAPNVGFTSVTETGSRRSYFTRNPNAYYKEFHAK